MTLKKSPGAPGDAWVMGSGLTLLHSSFWPCQQHAFVSPSESSGQTKMPAERGVSWDCVWHKGLPPHPLGPRGGGPREGTPGSVCRSDSCHVPRFQGFFMQSSARAKSVPPVSGLFLKHSVRQVAGQGAPEGQTDFEKSSSARHE